MKLRTFTASNIPDAMELVRREMGDNAIIISQGAAPNGKGVQITAAADGAFADTKIYVNPIDVIGEALDKHSTPRPLQDKILTLVERLELDDPVMSLAGAFDSMFKFAPLPEILHDKPILLMGVPGVGKTVTIAKLAARVAAKGLKTVCITTDSERAGAVEQLSAFTKILQVDLLQAKNLTELDNALAACPANAQIFIDTAGINILRDEDIANVKEIVKISNADPVLVCAAGGDAHDAAEIGAIFKSIGASRLLITRLDMTRRYGSILAAADAGQFKISNVSITPHIANGLSSINPMSLARIYLPNS